MPRILVVDDNKETVRAVKAYLERDGFEVFSAFDGETALHTLRREHPDLLVLDLMLPDRDGLDITRIVRKDATLRRIPIIMLTARVEEEDRITGLEIGADDYITKPFNPREVVARVRSVLRRSKGDGDDENERVLSYERLRLDSSRRQLMLDGQVIELTRIEFDLMHTLMSSPEHVFTRAELSERSIWSTRAWSARSTPTSRICAKKSKPIRKIRSIFRPFTVSVIASAENRRRFHGKALFIS